MHYIYLYLRPLYTQNVANGLTKCIIKWRRRLCYCFRHFRFRSISNKNKIMCFYVVPKYWLYLIPQRFVLVGFHPMLIIICPTCTGWYTWTAILFFLVGIEEWTIVVWQHFPKSMMCISFETLIIYCCNLKRIIITRLLFITLLDKSALE